MYQNLAILAFFILLYSLLAGRIEKTIISGPVLFVLLAFLAGPLFLNILVFNVEGERFKTLAELAYLNLFQLTYSVVLMAPSAIFSSMIFTEIIYHGASINQYIFDILAYVTGIVLLLYSPLLVFIPLLLKVKSRGINLFGNLMIKHNNEYMKKWVDEPPNPKEPVLGTMDNTSLADINGSYSPALNMKLVPINPRMFLISLAIISIPFLPLIFTLYSPDDLFRNLVRSVFDT